MSYCTPPGRPCAPPNLGVLNGLAPATLQIWLGQAQGAYAALQAGSRVETVAYTQGDGSRSVTYTRLNMASLTVWITQLQRALGLPSASRRPIRPYFL